MPPLPCLLRLFGAVPRCFFLCSRSRFSFCLPSAHLPVRLSADRRINFVFTYFFLCSFQGAFLKSLSILQNDTVFSINPSQFFFRLFAVSFVHRVHSSSSFLTRMPRPWVPVNSRLPVLPRKEVIQPHLPIRLPCYDFTPVIGLTFGSCSLAVRSLTSGAPNSHGVTGGVYKARERIHRGILIRDY